MPTWVMFVVVLVALWLALFAYWHPYAVSLKGMVLLAVAVVGLTAVSHFVT